MRGIIRRRFAERRRPDRNAGRARSSSAACPLPGSPVECPPGDRAPRGRDDPEALGAQNGAGDDPGGIEDRRDGRRKKEPPISATRISPGRWMRRTDWAEAVDRTSVTYSSRSPGRSRARAGRQQGSAKKIATTALSSREPRPRVSTVRPKSLAARSSSWRAAVDGNERAVRPARPGHRVAISGMRNARYRHRARNRPRTFGEDRLRIDARHEVGEAQTDRISAPRGRSIDERAAEGDARSRQRLLHRPAAGSPRRGHLTGEERKRRRWTRIGRGLLNVGFTIQRSIGRSPRWPNATRRVVLERLGQGVPRSASSPNRFGIR